MRAIGPRAHIILTLTMDIQGRSQNLCHFYPGIGLKWGLRVFSLIKITIVCQVYMLPTSIVIVSLNIREHLNAVIMDAFNLWLAET